MAALHSSPEIQETTQIADFSIDSLQLGDSTRSLLSPFYSKRNIIDEHDFINDKRNEDISSESSDDQQLSLHENDHKRYSLDVESQPNVKNNISTEKSTGSFSRRTSVLSGFHSNRSKDSTCHSEPETESSQTKEEQNLSPWEKWLLLKVVQDRKKMQTERQKKSLQKELDQKEIQIKTEKEMQDMAKRKEWLKSKKHEEKIKNEIALMLERKNFLEKQDEQARIQEKAKESFEKWLKDKEDIRKEQRKNKRLNEKAHQQNNIKRKEESEEAYKKWLQNSKSHQKSKSYHFGYLGNKVTGYYDWTTYPMPSYCNPQPWVAPTIIPIKHQRKIKLQNPSPPLLFKDIEDREKKSKTMHGNA
ncbi:coiled-coil domain-containing protein 34-like [Xenia sp. Carnegie-2017]|uniref:coiled-coil domain-containing protein 34-like n=1 Tax=Xenia sp. Carnegie-2017 TaxID=2897299 RepID=UPI001F037C19|nr:coiled-coil domain-containing protein 34-like [Xenia sp. Carnegie-2017]